MWTPAQNLTDISQIFILHRNGVSYPLWTACSTAWLSSWDKKVIFLCYSSHIYQLPLLQLEHTWSKIFGQTVSWKIVYRSTGHFGLCSLLNPNCQRKELWWKHFVLESLSLKETRVKFWIYINVYIYVFFQWHINFRHCSIWHLYKPTTKKEKK